MRPAALRALESLRRRLPGDPDVAALEAALCEPERDVGRRKDLVREAVEALWPGRLLSEQVRNLRTGLTRYAASAAWAVDRLKPDPPADPRAAAFWKILKADAGRILSERQYRRIFDIASLNVTPDSSASR